jgi:uncharacterized membrane protein required for colicin V production
VSWVDVLVVLLALVAGISGWRHGMAVALLSFVGVIGGAILGVQLAPLLAANLETKNTQVVVSIVVVVVLVALGETTGVYFGRHIRDRINGERTLVIDSALGSVLQAATVIVAAWLVALPLATASVPGLAAGVRGSSVLRAVDEVMPAPARQLPADLREVLDSSGFPDVMSPFAPTPITQVGPPDPALAGTAVVQDVENSVLKIRGKAPSCSRQLEGTGFVIGPELVMTNAHVVAGTDETSVEVVNSRGRNQRALLAHLGRAPLRMGLGAKRGARHGRGRVARRAVPARAPPPDAGSSRFPLDARSLRRRPDPRPDPAARPEHLRQRRGDARGLHRPRRGPLRQLRRPDHPAGRQGDRRRLRRGAGRLRDGLRADRGAGAADARPGTDAHPPGRHGQLRGLKLGRAVTAGPAHSRCSRRTPLTSLRPRG